MASRCLVSVLRRSRPAQVRCYSSDQPPFRYKIGKREVVGWGLNGEEAYLDLEMCPMPAVRFKEITPELQVLKEKEKGDWKKLTIQEKKELYRASFCQTFAEMDAPTGEWKSILGCVLGALGLVLFAFAGIKTYIYSPLPITFTEEYQLAMADRLRQIDHGPMTGFSSVSNKS